MGTDPLVPDYPDLIVKSITMNPDTPELDWWNETESGIYNKFTFRRYYIGGGFMSPDGYNGPNLKAPVFDYKSQSLGSIMKYILVDTALLIFYSIIFFVLGYVKFINMRVV